eukprot:GGOE01018881.1.p1 GENE.GGOE01018881.1~~GGOE01018881.1.p1  ORF type:complete len:152 (+),score=49.80 GGOE01018881.1:71-526(+)
MAPLPEAERRHLEEAFRVCAGGSSTVTLEGLDQLLRIAGCAVLPSELSDYMRRFGTDDAIDVGGVLDVVQREQSKVATTEELLALFKAIDTTKTGTVSVGELRAVLCDPKVPLSLQPEELQAALGLAHLQNAQRLSVAEYMNVLLSVRRWR